VRWVRPAITVSAEFHGRGQASARTVGKCTRNQKAHSRTRVPTELGTHPVFTEGLGRPSAGYERASTSNMVGP
jgi:hypothetical protein